MNCLMPSDKIAQPLVISGEVESPKRTVQRKFEIKAILIPILLLLVTLSPGIGSGVGITASKAITGGLVLLLTLPGVAASFLNMNRTKGRLILLGFLMMSVLNIFVAMANHLLLSYWLRLAFGSYVFGAMALTTSYYANTANRRHNLWVWLVIFLTLASFSQWFFAASSTIGLEESLESRSIGAKAGPLVATMILLPAVGKFLLKSLWLVLGFYSNVFLLILSISRTNYILLGVGILYSLVFIHRKFIRAILFLCFVLGLGLILLNTPVYDLVAQRFSHVGKDESSLARIDQAKSAITIGLGGNFQTLLFGKGFGSPYKVQYKLTRAGGYPHHDTLEFMPPHNDYAARILYCGLTGLILEILLFVILGYTFFTAIKRSTQDNIDPYAQVRVHGAMLVLICTAISGLGGGIFYLWNNNIFQGCILGIGLAEATEILSKKSPTSEPYLKR